MSKMFLPLSLVLLASGCGAYATSTPAATPPTTFSPVTSLAPLVEAVQPAVANVYVTSVQTSNVPPQWQSMLGIPSEREVQGQGSGFVISADGYLLTNNHVASDAKDIRVKFATGEEYPAKVIGVDKTSDIALLQVDAKKPLPYLKLGDSDAMQVGDWVVALGNPLGLGHTVTAGIVSGKGRNISDALFEEFLQTDASINPGNSGGPLVAMDGTVVGMNTAIIQGANSVGFAIPSSYIRGIVSQLQEKGKVARGYLGVEMATLNDAGKKQLGVDGGVMLVNVASGGPAELGGLRPGDVVLSLAGKGVDDTKDFARAVALMSPGTDVKVNVLRDGKSKDLTVHLGERPQ